MIIFLLTDKARQIGTIRFSDAIMRIKIDGKAYEIDLAVQSPRLAHTTQRQKENVVISPAGDGLHWIEIDEDLSTDGLIGAVHASPSGRATV